MVTTDDLKLGQALPNPMVVEVTNVDWNPANSRRAIVSLIDPAENNLGLIDYKGANTDTDWQVNHRYRISQCSVQDGGQHFEVALAPSTKTIIDPIGTRADTAQLLVVGDTHIGRTEHPGTGEQIDPIEAFSKAVSFGINQSVTAVIHVGDIFHENATVSQAKQVNDDVLEPLNKADIPFFYIRGNHEAAAGNKLLNHWKGGLATHLDTSGVAIGADIRLFGVDHYEEGNLPWSQIEFPNVTTESVAILILHQALEQVSGPGPKTVDLERFDRSFGERFTVVLTGHQHDARQVTWEETPVIYTGASERMSKVYDATDRVAWLLTIEDGDAMYEQYSIPE